MAKQLLITQGGETAAFAPARIDRAKIYGSRKRIAVDAQGRICARAALTADGSTLLLSGMTGQGYFTAAGRLVLRSEMVGLDTDGQKVEAKPSTLGAPQVAEGPVPPAEVLNLALEGVFVLAPEAAASGLLERLKAGEIYRVPFNYAASLELGTAYLAANDDGVFALVGKPVSEQWVEESQQFVPPIEEAEDADDLDFETI